jgi:hypothetical protein
MEPFSTSATNRDDWLSTTKPLTHPQYHVNHLSATVGVRLIIERSWKSIRRAAGRFCQSAFSYRRRFVACKSHGPGEVLRIQGTSLIVPVHFVISLSTIDSLMPEAPSSLTGVGAPMEHTIVTIVYRPVSIVSRENAGKKNYGAT